MFSQQLSHPHATGNHICYCWEDETEQEQIVADFLVGGFQAEEKVIYYVPRPYEEQCEKIKSWVRKRGWDVDKLLESSTLFLADVSSSMEGTAEVSELQKQLKETVQATLAAGYKGVRVTGEMTWAKQIEMPNSTVYDFESATNDLFDEFGGNLKGLCQYKMQEWPAESLLKVVNIHPHVISESQVCTNFYYIPPEEFIGKDISTSLFNNCMRNLKERKKLDEKLSAKNQQLEESNGKLRTAVKAKSDFLSLMSHEIRTPLNGIVGLSDLLTDGASSQAEQADLLASIRACADHLLNIVNDILDFSKIESGSMELEEASVEVGRCLEECTKLFSTVKKNLDIFYHIDKSVPVTIHSDATRLRQIIVNLISNAVKFTENGSITIAVKTYETLCDLHDLSHTPSPPSPHSSINSCCNHNHGHASHYHHHSDSHDDKEYTNNNKNTNNATKSCRCAKPGFTTLLFSVTDTGIGISQEGMSRLFKPFTQVDNTITRKFGGTGLGLVICRRLVELLGGQIWVESEENIGTQFNFTIQVKCSSEMLENHNTRNLDNKNILVVQIGPKLHAQLPALITSWNANVSVYNTTDLEMHSEIVGRKFAAVIYDIQKMDVTNNDIESAVKFITNALTHPIAQRFLCASVLLNLTPYTTSLFTDVLRKPIRQTQLYHLLSDSVAQFNSVPVKATNAIVDSKFAESVPLKILVAEDNLVNQRVINLMMQRMGYSIDIAPDGAVAMEKIRGTKYDLVFMDVQMPNVDGLEATRLILENKPVDLPVIVAMTAHALEGDREKCLAAGMVDYISKPITRIAVRDVIVKWFGEKRQLTV
eukprot:TRINITY_DN5908_c0_g1_i2.p1 TRINITY_DN5908_c0_g1~~TRINITY_DN5908_c0_g1_i2.p1  ORF type:complete len:820 (+),score=168.54 TRINITY_DN5908_c0_g1_i2:193-2652(+)